MSRERAPSSQRPIRRISEPVRIGRSTAHLRVASASHVGLVRSANEDAYVALALDRADASNAGPAHDLLPLGRRGVLLAVSDGMGGARDGAVASRITIEELGRWLREDSPYDLSDPEVLSDAVQDAHRAVWEASCRAGHQGHTRMGATLTAALVIDGRGFLAQVGDSRAYLIRRGVMTRLTTDQSVVQSLVDRGLMSESDAAHSPLRNVLTQAMGHQEVIEVVTSEVELADRDCLLLCSDGLTNELTEDEIRDVVVSSMRLDVAAARLVELANRHGGRDNITVVLGGIAEA